MLLRDRLGLPLEIETVGSSVARLGYDSAPLAFSKLQLGVASVRPVENPAVVANSDVDLPESYLGIVVVTSAAAAAAVGTETLLVADVSSAEDGCRCLSRRNWKTNCPKRILVPVETQNFVLLYWHPGLPGCHQTSARSASHLD